jgi:hypothetical protein
LVSACRDGGTSSSELGGHIYDHIGDHSMTIRGMVTSVQGCNSDYPWHEFDPEYYLEQNYVVLREEDRRTVALVRDFFARAFAGAPGRAGRRGIDVGTGANLYPALAMLPFCDRLTLYEYSEPNLAWLAGECAGEWPSWERVWAHYWPVLCEHDSYAEFPAPNVELAKCANVTAGSVFDLGALPGNWDVGTMFFVAESITPNRAEFVAAVGHFLDALCPGAPFAIACMAHSDGYHVAGKFFPAFAVGCEDVRDCLRHRASGVRVEYIGPGDEPLRDGYRGMILACGRVRGGRRPTSGNGGPGQC